MAVMVEEVTPSKSGKALRVKLGGTWYNAFLDSGLNGQKGKMIEAEIQTNEKFGPSIKAWRPVSDAAPQVSPPSAGHSPQPPAVAAPRYAEPNPNVAPWWMPFVSNSVAHAIAAGHVNSPEAIKTWAIAARNAANACVATTPPTTDEDVPF